MRNPYLKTDVLILKDISNLKFDNNIDLTDDSILNIVKELNKNEVKISGIVNDIEEEINKINFKSYGFKSKNDYSIILHNQMVKNQIKISLLPRFLYKLDDNIELPTPPTNNTKMFIKLLNDTFERLKNKVENILSETEEAKNIRLYSKKNIQVLKRLFYESKIKIISVKERGSKEEIFNSFILSIYIINLIIYYQDMFSAFYKEDIFSKSNMKTELFDSLGMNLLCKLSILNDIRPLDNKKDTFITWNGQINTLITLIYDLLHKETENKKTFLEADIKDITFILNKYVQDKNGNKISKKTIETILKDYRSEKRASGKKRINLKKYIDLEN